MPAESGIFGNEIPDAAGHRVSVLRDDTVKPVLADGVRSWAPNVGAGDYYVIPHPDSFFDGEVVVARGASHGTPYLYDRTVPMLVRAPALIDAGAVIEDPVDFTAFAALEAAFAGLDTRTPREILDSHRAGPKAGKP